jgi:hypothetical protein
MAMFNIKTYGHFHLFLEKERGKKRGMVHRRLVIT